MSKSNLHIIYLTVCDYTDRKYVGRHKVSNLITFDPSYIGTGSLITKLIRKYGKKSFHRTILCKIRTDDLEKVRKLERYYISKYNTLYPNGLNWLNGDLDTEENPMYMSQNRKIVSENSKKMRGENNPMFGKHHSEETKRLMSISHSGENNPWFGVTGKNNPLFGKSKSKEHRDKIRKAHLGKKLSEETKHKISKTRRKRIKDGEILSRKGVCFTQEHRKHISENHANFSGKNNPMYGSTFIWITNGLNNKRHNPNQEIPEGWFRGFSQFRVNS